jgi:hypothetical protein
MLNDRCLNGGGSAGGRDARGRAVHSFAHRYFDGIAIAPTAAGRSPVPRITSWVACKHPGWDASQAHAFCQALQQRSIHRLPGYTGGPWAITNTSAPAAQRRY